MADLDTQDVKRRTAVPTGSGSDSAQIVTARRRLMLGAAAVLPSVVTLPAGAQLAAGRFNCIARSTTKAGGFIDLPGDMRFTSLQDEWLRKQVFSGQAVRAGRTVYCTTWDQPSVLAIASWEKSSSGMGYKALPGTTWSVGGDPGDNSIKIGTVCPPWDPSQGAGPGSWCYAESIENISASPTHYALVYVSEDGTFAALEPGPGMVPIRSVCYASILGDRATSLG